MEFILFLILIAFACEYVDATIGGGYGTILAPTLIVLGYDPKLFVPSLLLSQLAGGFMGSVAHHRLQNADFTWGEPHMKAALVLAGCSVFGVLAAVFLSLQLPAVIVKTYIGVLVFAIGASILLTLNRTIQFSWKRLVATGVFAAFNKGLSGGGYGPVVTGGQLISGINDAKNAVAITALAEALTCCIGVIAYYYVGVDWSLAPSLIIGSMVAAPLSALTVNRFDSANLKKVIGSFIFLLGVVTLSNVFVF